MSIEGPNALGLGLWRDNSLVGETFSPEARMRD